MRDGFSEVEYELRTRSMKIKHNLDLLYEKYGINDFALSTGTSWNLGPFEINPCGKTASENNTNRCRKISISELLFEQCMHQ